MHISELLSTLFLACEDMHKISDNLTCAAEDLQRRGLKEVRKGDKKQKSATPHEYLEANAVAWTAQQLDVIACQIQAVHKRIESTIKY